jgi:pimeloyl-[acyl-carrier protein] methyl ester esterase
VRGGDWKHGVSTEILQGFASGLRDDYRGTLERFVALEAFGSEHAKDEIRALREELFARGEPTAAVLADGLALLESADLRASLPALPAASLWLAGRRDRLVDPRAMAAAAALAPDAVLHVVEHAGHAPFLTHADDVATRLAAFLAVRA